MVFISTEDEKRKRERSEKTGMGYTTSVPRGGAPGQQGRPGQGGMATGQGPQGQGRPEWAYKGMTTDIGPGGGPPPPNSQGMNPTSNTPQGAGGNYVPPSTDGGDPPQIGGGDGGDPPPVNPPPNPANPGFNFEEYLRNIMQGSGQGNTFTDPNTGPMQGVPAFTPGANPFNQGAGSFDYQSGVGAQTQEAVLDRLKNPSRYDSDQAQSTFDRLNQSLSQQFGMQRQGIDSDMSRRGIFQSTIAGGKLGDLASNQAFAQSGLASNIALDQARTYGADQSGAISQALGYDQQQFGQQMAQTGQNFQADLAGRQFNEGQAMNKFGTGMAANQQRYGQGLQSFGANQQAEQQGYNQRNTAINNLFGFGQQQFTNQLDTARFNQSQDYQNSSLMMQALGLT